MTPELYMPDEVKPEQPASPFDPTVFIRGRVKNVGDAPGPLPPPAVRPLPHINGYEVLEELGKGGMGVVYLARHLALQRHVALKMIHTGHHTGEEETARFFREARAIASLQHHHIVQVFEVGEQSGRPFLCLEFCPGGSLAQRLGGTPLPPREAAALVETLARAMQHAHGQGIVHRDLKPANVLLGAGGTPKVSDFGLAKKLDEAGQTVSGAVMGTASYMAPEQARGRGKEVGPAADTYALGAILYECLTGRPPFKGPDTPETLLQVIGAEPIPPRRLQPRVPRDLETICLKCLRKEPQRRYASAELLADDLRRFLEGRAICARPTSGLERAWRWARRNPWPAGAATLAVVALLGVLVYGQTRPAYLDVRVKPGEATVLLDGRPLLLEDGRGLVAWKPGRFLLQASAPDHEPHEQPVVLVRGQGSTVAAEIELVSRFGFCRISSEPPPATVELVDGRGRVVGRGATPFASDRLPSGEYLARVQKDGYHLREVKVIVPVGERQHTAPVVKLIPLEKMTEGMALLAFMRQTTAQQIDFGGLDDPRTSLAEALDQLSKLHGVTFEADEKSFEEMGLNDVRRTQIIRSKALPPLKTSFGTLLRLLLARVPLPSGATVIPGNASLRIVSGKRAAETSFTVLHPVGDLTTGPDGQSPERLLAAVREHIGALSTWDAEEGRFKDRKLPDSALRYLPSARVLYTSLSWSSQERVADYLDELRKATLGLRRDDAAAYNTLGHSLAAQRRWAEAAIAYRKAIQLRPDHAESHFNLGTALDEQNKPDEARAAYRKAISLQTDFTEACNLGNTLHAQKKTAEALAAYRKAIALKPSSAWAHYHLGTALDAQKKADEARAAYLKAIDLAADSTEAARLGDALYDQTSWDAAAAAHRKAIQLKADHAPAHNGLGLALLEQERFAEALAAFRKADQLQPRHFAFSNNVRVAEQLRELARKYPSCLAGKERPASPSEGVELARFCAYFRGHYRAAARFYTDAFKADPKVATAYFGWSAYRPHPTRVDGGTPAHPRGGFGDGFPPHYKHRYHAARCTLLAAAGKGNDAMGLEERERTALRLQALGLLGAELEGYRGWIGRYGGRAVLRFLPHWQSDPDLISVRENDGLAKLPEAERKQWQQLWADAGALIRQAALLPY